MASAWQPAVDDRQLRLLALALLASLVLHAALLFAFPSLREARKILVVPGPMTARLVVPTPPVAPPAVEQRPQAAKPVPRAAPDAKAAPAPAPAAPVLSVEPSRPVAEPAAVIQASPAAAAPAAVPPRVEPQPVATAPAAGTLLQYRLEIMDLARRYKRYPRLAIDNNWEGRVEVRMVIGASGAIVSLSVKASAGYESLDQEALAMLRKAKSAATIPQALRGREFALEVPVIFSLKDAGSG